MGPKCFRGFRETGPEDLILCYYCVLARRGFKGLVTMEIIPDDFELKWFFCCQADGPIMRRGGGDEK